MELGITKQRVSQICKKHNIQLTPYSKIKSIPWIERRKGLQFIYIIAETTDGPVKIGRTWDVDLRLEALDSGNPRGLRIFFKTPIKHPAHETETAIHSRLKEFELGREWFSCSVQEAEKNIKLVLSASRN
jgi:hypothetical protein